MLIEEHVKILEARLGIKRGDLAYGQNFFDFAIPGNFKNWYFIELTNAAGYELRIYCDFAKE